MSFRYRYSSISTSPVYGVYLSINKIFQYLWFLSLPRLMLAASRKLLNQGFQVVKWKSSLRINPFWHTCTFKTSQNGDGSEAAAGNDELYLVSYIVGRWSWFYLHIYAVKYVYFWILQRRLARHWGASIIHAGSWRGYMKKNSRIELCMVDKGFGGRQYQKTTLASIPKRDW